MIIGLISNELMVNETIIHDHAYVSLSSSLFYIFERAFH